MKLKRLIMLALCLALVCGLSVTAFAANLHTDRVDYDGGANWAQSYAKITRYSTYGYTEADSIYDSPSTYVTATYSYIDLDGNVQFGNMSDNQSGMSYVNKTFSINEIDKMDYAYYEFWAQIQTNSGMQDYEPNIVRIDY